jgi:uncharacterized protein (TIGR03437 family)
LKSVVGVLSSSAEPIALAPAAPAIFTPGIVIANTATLVSTARPAHPGEYISIFCTGLGAVANQPATGADAPSSPLATTIAPPSVHIGNVDSAPSFSGLAPGFVGLYQVNVQIPANAPTGDHVPVSLTIAGITSNAVPIAIQ